MNKGKIKLSFEVDRFKVIQVLAKNCESAMDDNFANLYEDYPKHRTGVWWASDYDGEDYYDFYPQMVARLDSAEDSEQASKDRAYLEEWYFEAFGTYNIKYNFSNELEEIHSMMVEAYEEA